MRELDVTFNEKENAGFKPILQGEYPAHITSFESRDLNTKAGKATVFNLRYTVSEEVAKMEQTLYEMDGYNIAVDDNGRQIVIKNGDGKPAMTDSGFLKGRVFRDNGYFCFTEKEGSSKNGRYFNLLSSLDVELSEIEVDGVIHKKLALIEEEDVVGKPCTIRIQQQEYVTHETRDLPESEQEKRKAWKVFTVKPWDGKKFGKSTVLSLEELTEDVPF
tara:strand:+ start:8683 stop:9336 length:654 start_codon:yes stop_codon:yes gene_type:complete